MEKDKKDKKDKKSSTLKTLQTKATTRCWNPKCNELNENLKKCS